MCCSVLQCVAACGSVLQRLSVNQRSWLIFQDHRPKSKACCSVLQRAAMCCSALQRVAACCSGSTIWADVWGSSFKIQNPRYDASCCSVLQRDAACCSVLQRVAACCSVLQRVVVYEVLDHAHRVCCSTHRAYTSRLCYRERCYWPNFAKVSSTVTLYSRSSS